MSEIPVMQIRHTEKGEWFVAAKWPSGEVEDIRGFKSESDANEWIAKELQTWLDRRKEASRA
jgi:hypothetical protein